MMQLLFAYKLCFSLELPGGSVLVKVRFVFAGRDVPRLKSSLLSQVHVSVFLHSCSWLFQINAGIRSGYKAVVAEMWPVWTISSSIQDFYCVFGICTEGAFRVLLPFGLSNLSCCKTVYKIYIRYMSASVGMLSSFSCLHVAG